MSTADFEQKVMSLHTLATQLESDNARLRELVGSLTVELAAMHEYQGCEDEDCRARKLIAKGLAEAQAVARDKEVGDGR